jgi:thioredoxin reductase (NADPH)
MHLARHARSVRVAVRGDGLSRTMSRYLVDRVERSPRIEILTRTELVRVNGSSAMESITLRDGGGAEQDLPVAAVFVMIGAEPCTEAATGMLGLDASGYLLCGQGAAECEGHLRWPLADRPPQLLETVRPGVFAAGDVRAGASNRVAGAVGDGALTIRFAHEILDV